MSTWTELQFEVPVAFAEILAAEMGPLAGGVEIRDAGTLLAPAEPGRAVIVALLPPAEVDAALATVEEAADRARQAGLSPDPLVVRRREAHEDEWRDVWKQFFRALRVGRRFLVRPSWDAPPAAPGDLVIDIDPGRAFGTGGHPSTRLVLALAETVAHPVARFLDLGCGSGILSVGAARLWRNAEGLAVDVDAEAVACAAENLARNAVAAVRAVTGDLDVVTAVYDLVMANIQADVLIPLAPRLARAVAPGGTLILSGILVEQADDVARAYAAAGLGPGQRHDEGEWTALAFAAAGPAA